MTATRTIAWRSLQPNDKDLKRCAHEIQRLLRVKNVSATFSSLHLARILKRSYILTVWRAVLLEGAKSGSRQPRPGMEWTTMATAIFVRRSVDNDPRNELPTWDEARISLVAYDLEALLPEDEADPLIIGLGLILQSSAFLQRSHHPPFDLTQITRLQIPRTILDDNPAIERHFGDEMCGDVDGKVCSISAHTKKAKF